MFVKYSIEELKPICESIIKYINDSITQKPLQGRFLSDDPRWKVKFDAQVIYSSICKLENSGYDRLVTVKYSDISLYFDVLV